MLIILFKQVKANDITSRYFSNHYQGMNKWKQVQKKNYTIHPYIYSLYIVTVRNNVVRKW